jgi:hypothetical protein
MLACIEQSRYDVGGQHNVHDMIDRLERELKPRQIVNTIKLFFQFNSVSMTFYEWSQILNYFFQ